MPCFLRGYNIARKDRTSTGPTDAERLRWRATEIVHQALERTPNFKEAVKSTIAELKQLDKQARQKLADKKKEK